MKKSFPTSLFKKISYKHVAPYAAGTIITGLFLIYVLYGKPFSVVYHAAQADTLTEASSTTSVVPAVLDKVAYVKKLRQLAHFSLATSTISGASPVTPSASSTSTVNPPGSFVPATPGHLWPASAPYPEAGALLPFNRIVAYYGNFYSAGMGILGEYPEAQVITQLQATVAQWQAADPTTPVIPAIDYIAVTAQASAGPDGKYRLRMPASQIQKAIDMAAQVHGIVILDVQVGLSTVNTEIPLLEPYLKLPQVELAIDPEFSMKTGAPPGTVIGSYDAKDINFTANYLAGLVNEYNLPPKILIVHRFTQAMVTNYKNIQPLPQVEIVMDMDGWGGQAKKIGTYTDFIEDEPVQFTGFKLFYKNDVRPPSAGLMTPQQVLNLTPSPSFIQYQ